MVERGKGWTDEAEKQKGLQLDSEGEVQGI
jgi:hypothetical protein